VQVFCKQITAVVPRRLFVEQAEVSGTAVLHLTRTFLLLQMFMQGIYSTIYNYKGGGPGVFAAKGF
jgi:hypothetical protein